MSHHELAGRPVGPDQRVDIPALVSAYHGDTPDPSEPTQQVAFGTSGHRGSSIRQSFNDAHIAAIAQAIAEYRAAQGIVGPLFVAQDTHALSHPALQTALQVFAGNDVKVVLDGGAMHTPTPVLSHAVLRHNATRSFDRGDGVVITPSHNPPEDGGFKYNPPTGGPADTDATGVIQDRANELLHARLRGVKRVTQDQADARYAAERRDLTSAYVADLAAFCEVLKLDSFILVGHSMGGRNSMSFQPLRFGNRFDSRSTRISVPRASSRSSGLAIPDLLRIGRTARATVDAPPPEE
jgi:phosphoglucomutase